MSDDRYGGNDRRVNASYRNDSRQGSGHYDDGLPKRRYQSDQADTGRSYTDSGYTSGRNSSGYSQGSAYDEFEELPYQDYYEPPPRKPSRNDLRAKSGGSSGSGRRVSEDYASQYYARSGYDSYENADGYEHEFPSQNLTSRRSRRNDDYGQDDYTRRTSERQEYDGSGYDRDEYAPYARSESRQRQRTGNRYVSDKDEYGHRLPRDTSKLPYRPEREPLQPRQDERYAPLYDDFEDIGERPPRYGKNGFKAQSNAPERSRQQYDAFDDMPQDDNAPQSGGSGVQRRNYVKKSIFGELWERLGPNDEKRKLNLILVCCVALVVIGVILCVTLQACSGCSDGGIPIVEQGDGEEEISGIISGTEVISTADGNVIIDQEAGQVETFTVAVTDANGTYSRTNVSKEEAAALEISGQDNVGFSFILRVNGGELAGYAYFNGATTAAFELETGLIGFTFESGGIKVYHTMLISNFGDKSADGTYIKGEASYVEDSAQQSSFDADIRSSSEVKSALKSLLSSSDYRLMNDIFANGTCPVFENKEKTVDKNGKEITVDGQMNAVKYYAFISGTGEELVLICGKGGKVYIGISDGSSYRYYTNDDSYKASAPTAISGQAEAKSMTLEYK